MSARAAEKPSSQSKTTRKVAAKPNVSANVGRKQPAPTAKPKAKPKPKAQSETTPEPTPEDSEDISPLLLTVERAAQKLGICRDFMYRLLSGPHPAMRSVKIGRSRRVPVGELEAYIARRLSEVA